MIKSSDHYDITSNTLQIHGITIADSHIYRCNVSNPCGSVISTPGYFLKVIEYPLPITEFKITQGPFKTYITLSWDPAVATSDMPVDGYIVKLKEGTNKFVIYQNLSYYMTNEDVIKTSGTTLTGLKPGTNYTVKIFTFNIAGQKGSNEILFGTEVSGMSFEFLIIYLSICLSIHSPITLIHSTCLLFSYPIILISIHLSVHPCIHLSICLSIHSSLSTYPSIIHHPSIHLFIHPSIHLFIQHHFFFSNSSKTVLLCCCQPHKSHTSY